MTGDELDRAIDFLLKSQATLEARIEQVNKKLGERIQETSQRIQETNQQLAELNNLVSLQGQTVTNFIQVTARRFEQHDEMIREIKETDRRISEAIEMLAEADIVHAAAQSQTDERLDALINTVERYISGRGEGRP